MPYSHFHFPRSYSNLTHLLGFATLHTLRRRTDIAYWYPRSSSKSVNTLSSLYFLPLKTFGARPQAQGSRARKSVSKRKWRFRLCKGSLFQGGESRKGRHRRFSCLSGRAGIGCSHRCCKGRLKLLISQNSPLKMHSKQSVKIIGQRVVWKLFVSRAEWRK